MTRKRTDANHTAIRDAFLSLGATVRSTAMVGDGFPDLAVGWRGLTLLVEVKDGSKPPSARTLTDDEKKFHETWRGQVCVIESVEDVINLLGGI